MHANPVILRDILSNNARLAYQWGAVSDDGSGRLVKGGFYKDAAFTELTTQFIPISGAVEALEAFLVSVNQLVCQHLGLVAPPPGWAPDAIID